MRTARGKRKAYGGMILVELALRGERAPVEFMPWQETNLQMIAPMAFFFLHRAPGSTAAKATRGRLPAYHASHGALQKFISETVADEAANSLLPRHTILRHARLRCLRPAPTYARPTRAICPVADTPRTLSPRHCRRCQHTPSRSIDAHYA